MSVWRQAQGAGKTGKPSDGWALGDEPARGEESKLETLRHNPRHNDSLQLCLCWYLLEMNGGRGRTRTCDLLRVKQAL